jgi:anti-sigma regulatory factor (Ser/Thr protein kinase)
MCEIYETAEGGGLDHVALLYGDLEEFLAGTSGFIEQARRARQPAMVAVPGARIEPMREALGSCATAVRFLDMNDLGRNPGRIIPEVRDWVDRQRAQRAWFVGEPIWSGREGDETVEAIRHEALINLAFADTAANILCPYDTASLNTNVLADAQRTHPHLVRGDARWPSGRYTDPIELWRAEDRLPPEPGPEQSPAGLEFDGDLAGLRRFVAEVARQAGMAASRIEDLVLAADEAATNALVHGRRPARLRAWRDRDRLVCEISDGGRLEDPLAGRRRPKPEWPGGRGLWLINQLCDLVELRPLSDGTMIRLHVDVARR